MTFLYDAVRSLSETSKKCIIFCDEKTILQSKTFNEVFYQCEIFYEYLSKYFNKSTECIGLLMNHNIHLPAIIVSLQRLNKCFVFVTPGNLRDSCMNLQINWVISSKIIATDHFQTCAEITLDTANFVLLKRTLQFKKPYNHNAFCIMLTSGSTGNSKIIKIPYDCIKKNVESLSKIFQINNSDLIFWGSPLTFDPTLIELLLALLNGACLVIVSHKVQINPYLLYESLFNVTGITFLQMVPSVFTRWDEHIQGKILNSTTLRILALGGETFPSQILGIHRNKNIALFNLYGTTELSCWATIHEVTDEGSESEIPLGKALEDTIIQLRNKDGKILANGQGEIFIGSMIRNCIIDKENPETLCKPIFRATGDIGELNEKGLFYKFRKNRLIKRFGHRVNLTKTEELITQSTGLSSRCIWISSTSKLLAYLVIDNFTNAFKEKILDKLRVKLLNVLPEASFPDHLDILRKFPLTNHGKIDDRSLTKYYTMTLSERNKVASSNVELFSILSCKYLGLNQDVLRDVEEQNFMELGGSSISILQLNNDIKDILGPNYPDNFLNVIFERSLKYCKELLQNYKHVKRNVSEVSTVSKKFKQNENYNVLWRYDLKACVDSSPVVFQKNNKWYAAIGSFSHLFVVLDESGDEILKLSLPENIQTTALISETSNSIFVGCFDGCLYCFDFIKNEEVWKFTTGNIVTSSARFCQKNCALVFGSYDEVVYCLRIDDGFQMWSKKLFGSIAASPLVEEAHSHIYIATTRGRCYCLNEFTGEILWEHNSDGPIFGSPTKVANGPGVIFPTVHNSLICLSTANGDLIWNFKTDGPVFSSLTPYKDCVIFGCHDTNLYIVKPLVDSCILVGKVKLSSEISSSAFVYETRSDVFIINACNSGIVSIINFKTLLIVKSLTLPGEVFSSPVVCDDKLYIGCRDNYLYCIELVV